MVLVFLLVSVGRCPGVVLGLTPRPARGRRRGGGGGRPGRAAGPRARAPPLLRPPQVGQRGPRVGRRLRPEQLPGLLGVALLQIVPLVHVPALQHGRVLPLLLEEGLQLQLLLLLELPRLVVLEFLESFLLFLVNDLESAEHEKMCKQSQSGNILVNENIQIL